MGSTERKRLFQTLIATLRQYDESLHLRRRLGMLALSAVAAMFGVTANEYFDSFDDES